MCHVLFLRVHIKLLKKSLQWTWMNFIEIKHSNLQGLTPVELSTGVIRAAIRGLSAELVCDLHLKHEKLLCRLNKWCWNTCDETTVQRKPHLPTQFTVLSFPYEPVNNRVTFKNSLALWICCQEASVFSAEKNFKLKHSRAVLSWVWLLLQMVHTTSAKSHLKNLFFSDWGERIQVGCSQKESAGQVIRDFISFFLLFWSPFFKLIKFHTENHGETINMGA